MQRFYKIVIALGFVVGLSGCGMTFVYNNLSLLTPWLVDDFITLDREQKKLYQTHLETLHQWHRQHELPEYKQLLLSILDDLEDDQLNTENFGEHIYQMRRRWEVLVEQAIPALTEMSLTLSDQQVDELLAKLEKANQERLEDSEDLTLKQRKKKLLSDVKDWLGKLSEEQKNLLEDSLAPDNENAALTVAAHRRFQTRLGNLLTQRQADNFAENLAVLLADPLDSDEGKALNDYRLDNFNKRILLYSKLWRLASDKQKRKVRNKLQNYVDDIDSLIKH